MDPDRRSFVGSALAVFCACYNLLATPLVENVYKFFGFAQPKPVDTPIVPLSEDPFRNFSWERIECKKEGTVWMIVELRYRIRLLGKFGGRMILENLNGDNRKLGFWFSELTDCLDREYPVGHAAALLVRHGFEIEYLKPGRRLPERV